MAYMHIENLYKNQTIMMFRQCFALEKIHGTSAHIRFTPGEPMLHFFNGGVPYIQFRDIFDPLLLDKFNAIQDEGLPVTIYGEAYGGKCQGMKETYGEKLRFTAFEVNRGGKWLSVPRAEAFVKSLGLDFVPYNQIPTNIDRINEERDRDSLVAVKPGCIREGVVLRPIQEFTLNNGARVICKHKRAEFSERASKRDTDPDPERQVVLDKAEAIAEEWVTPMRLRHVLDKLTGAHDLSNTPQVISAMQEDILREGKDEVLDCRDVHKAIGRATAKLYKKYVETIPNVQG